ncbi:hypothetical protein D3C85_1806720 [compost metagenome]
MVYDSGSWLRAGDQRIKNGQIGKPAGQNDGGSLHPARVETAGRNKDLESH